MSSSKRNDLIAAAEIVGGIIFTGIAIALSDAGFHIWGFVLGFLAVVCGLTVAAHHLKKFGLKYVRSGLVISLFLAAGLFGFLAFHKPPVESKPHPHLKEELWTDIMPPLPLDDGAFRKKDSSAESFFVHARLVIPFKPEKTNINISFVVKNEPDSPVVAEDLVLLISLPKDLDCIPEKDWEKAIADSAGYSTDGGINKKEVKSWVYAFPPLVPGGGKLTPSIQIPLAASSGRIFCSIVLRAKDFSPESLAFFLVPTNWPHQGVVELLGK